MKISQLNEKSSPKGDSRLRVNRSERLWVFNRVWSKDKTHVIGYVAVVSIERSVYGIFGKKGEWVRYQNRYHLLHKPQELEMILSKSNNFEYGFHNNEVHSSRPANEHTDIAHFIFSDEIGLIT